MIAPPTMISWGSAALYRHEQVLPLGSSDLAMHMRLRGQQCLPPLFGLAH